MLKVLYIHVYVYKYLINSTVDVLHLLIEIKHEPEFWLKNKKKNTFQRPVNNKYPAVNISC